MVEVAALGWIHGVTIEFECFARLLQGRRQWSRRGSRDGGKRDSKRLRGGGGGNQGSRGGTPLRHDDRCPSVQVSTVDNRKLSPLRQQRCPCDAWHQARHTQELVWRSQSQDEGGLMRRQIRLSTECHWLRREFPWADDGQTTRLKSRLSKDFSIAAPGRLGPIGVHPSRAGLQERAYLLFS